MINKKLNKGFTLIELLVVIAIIAILAVVVILTLNPAQLLAQARDSNRTSDMATLKSAISLYLADVSSTYIGSSTPGNFCYISAPLVSGQFRVPNSATLATTTFTATTTCSSWMTTENLSTTTAPVSATSLRGITGPVAGVLTGWLPVNFNAISAGSPVGNLPVDPNNTADNGTRGFFYSYLPNTSNNTFKLGAFMESTKYAAGGSGDVSTNDGGPNVNVFEGGTNPAL